MSNIEDYAKVLILGKGKVGSTIGHLIEESKQYEVKYEDPFLNLFAPQDYMPDIIHITFPLYERDQYLTDVQRTIQRFVVYFEDKYIDFLDRKVLVIIDSTIIMGVVSALQHHYSKYCDFVYSPIRATDKVLGEEITKYFRYFAPVGSENKDEVVSLMEEYYTSLGLKYKVFKDADALVLGKLASVGWYTMNIAYVQQLNQICSQHNLDFNEVYTEFNKDETIGHRYDPETKEPDYIMGRPTFFPGVIKGKCCIPNAVLMIANQYGDSSFWRWIYQTNEKQKLMEMNKDKIIIDNKPLIEPGTKINHEI